ncbi:Protein accumulation and replication of chloroplast 3 [Vitis vinifera]|uniref:Protein accumulation and replication of chloroplast 3 n=1 Tax=Vitis vinifera TaxID=29760 RepID=A0A438EJB4_VITVI|nr:Protein accumulation and replication of chloroplast 3 [Vitis vinifera]
MDKPFPFLIPNPSVPPPAFPNFNYLCSVIDTDTLLKKDLVTLDEALKTADNGVLLAINAISGMHKKLIDAPHDNMKELKGPEIIKILESHKEAKIGFGAGYNIETSILQAIYDCPFLSVCLKDLNGTVICILASSVIINNSDVLSFLHAFRENYRMHERDHNIYNS